MTQESNQEIALRIFEETGAILTGHFVYASGRHGKTYVEEAAIDTFTSKASCLCRMIVEHFTRDQVDVVIAPAMGGIVLSQWAASHLGTDLGREVLAVYAEKSPAGELFLINHGWDRLITGRRVLVLDDILTTGGSVKKVVRAVREVGGEVVGVGALWNRGGVTTADLGDVPKLISLINQGLESWEPTDCPLCAQKVPVDTKVGHGAASVVSH